MDRSAKSLKSMPDRTDSSVSYGPKRLGKSLKAGDEERIRIMNMVKSGEISIDSAMQEAEGLGVASLPREVTESKPDVKEDEVYNFGVHKFGKHNKSVKCVLQLDFPEHTVYFIQKGQRNMKYDFSSIKTSESEDGTTRVFISMDDTTEFELDANSFEDRNKIVRLLNYIIEQQSYSSGGQYMSGLQAMSNDIIKEGVIEKKGHNAAMLVWAKRFVRIRAGEILYFKVGDESSNDNALNVIQVGHGAAFVKKVDTNAFVIVTNKREYSFRMAPSSYQALNIIEKSRDDWIIAFQEASRPARFNSIAAHVDDSRDPMVAASDQEKFLKTAVKTLQEELEQLNTILTIVDAPFKASIQVRKVREIVQKLDEQVKTGLLSWTMRSMAQQHAVRQRTQGNLVSNAYSTLAHHGPLQNPNDLSYSTLDYHGGDQTGSPMNVSTVKHGYDFASSRQAIMHANRHERAYEPCGDEGRPNVRPYEPCGDEGRPNARPYQPYGDEGRPNARPYQPCPDIGSANAHSLLMPRNNEKEQGNALIGNISTGNMSQLEIDQMYAKVNKERQLKTAISTAAEDANVYDADHPPPLPPRQLSRSSSAVSSEEPRKDLDSSGGTNTGKMVSSPLEDASSAALKQETTEIKTDSSPVPPSPPTLPEVAGPPPPPPPMMGGVPPPPPLPGMMAPSLLSHKKAIAPNKKLKPLFWMKVPDMTVPKSFWVNAQERDSVFDFDLLENIFQAEEKKVQKLAPATANPNKTLLDSKKAQNLGIFLSGFKMKPEDIQSKLMIFNEEEGFLLEQIVALKRFQPNTDELELYRNFQGQIDELPLVDKFMLKLCLIPNLNKKLDILLTIMEVPSQCEEIWPPLMTMLDACKSLDKSKRFEKLLEYILALGNYVNGGTARGVAYGFKLSSLVKLVNVQSNDKEYNLLRFLVEQLFDEDPESLKCYEEMPGLLKPMEASIKGLSAEVDVMKTDLKKARNSIETLLKAKISNDERIFLEKAETFIASYASQIDELSANCKQTRDLSESILKKFGETSSTSFESWLNSVAEFMKQLKKAVEDEDHRRKRRSRRALSLIDEDLSIMGPSSPTDRRGQGFNLNEFQPVLEELAETKKNSSPEKRSKNHYDENFFIKEKPLPTQRSLDERSGAGTMLSHNNSERIKSNDHNSSQKRKNNDQRVQPQPFERSEQSGVLRTKAYELKNADIVHSSSCESIDKAISDEAISENLTSGTTAPVKHGFLEKLSGGKKRAPKWDKRYFEITSSGYLYYYKKPFGKLAGSVYLRGCPVQLEFGNPLVILIESEERDWQLRANTAEEAKSWVDTLVAFAHRM